MTKQTLQESPEKSNSESLESILARLSPEQRRFVVARQDYSTDKETAEELGIKPDTVYHWPDYVNAAVGLFALETVDAAKAIRTRALVKAMMVKVAALDSEDERVRQAAATEIIEWELGKASQRQEISVSDIDHAIEYELARLAEARQGTPA